MPARPSRRFAGRGSLTIERWDALSGSGAVCVRHSFGGNSVRPQQGSSPTRFRPQQGSNKVPQQGSVPNKVRPQQGSNKVRPQRG
jgi:hypothetical protein